MKLKLISLQDVLRVAATILHPPIRSVASSPTSRLDGEAKNALIGKAFKFSTECSGAEGNGDAPDENAAPDEDEDDDEDDVRTSGIHAPATAKLKLVLNKLVNLIKTTMRKIAISLIEISEI